MTPEHVITARFVLLQQMFRVKNAEFRATTVPQTEIDRLFDVVNLIYT